MEITEKKLKVTLDIADPESLTGKQYMTYWTTFEGADRKEGSWTAKDKLFALFFSALTLCDKAVWTSNGVEKDLKALGEDAPARIMKWVGEQGNKVINQTLDIPEA